jgi:hypothetical protein
MKNSANNIANCATAFYKGMSSREFSNEYSWEHCYRRFYESFHEEKPDYDELAINLAFYLASWGMYRGSSFITKYDYRVHIGAVERIHKRYKDLCGLSVEDFPYKKDELWSVKEELDKYYAGYRNKISEVKTNISDTLISKILLGTLGCIPAYDRYFVEAIGKKHGEKIAQGTLTQTSIEEIFGYYKKHEETFEEIRKQFHISGTQIKYPQMKVLDLGLWQLGYDYEIGKA